MSVKIYNQQQVKVSFGGLPLENGKAEDEWISIVPMSPTFESKSSADGEVVRSKKGDRRDTITITLMSTSAENSKLAAIHTLDQTSEAGQVLPFVLTDLNGTELYVAEAWIEKGPDLTHGASAPTRAWTLCAVRGVKFEGGHV